MAVKDKYKSMNSFYKYYSGEKVAPIPTIFIGGNHEASNHLRELYAPNFPHFPPYPLVSLVSLASSFPSLSSFRRFILLKVISLGALEDGFVPIYTILDTLVL